MTGFLDIDQYRFDFSDQSRPPVEVFFATWRLEQRGWRVAVVPKAR
jgi:hypothetical protein